MQPEGGPPAFRTGRISLDGGSLEVGWWGSEPDTTPTLVLLHEGLGSVALWRDFPARLATATGCGVFAYSRFGYGRSDPTSLPRPLDYMQREAREVLPRVLDVARLRRVVLVGHSDGASIAATYAGIHDDPRVRGVVLIAPHFFVEQLSVQSIAAVSRDYHSGALRERLARHHTHVDVAFRGWAKSWLNPGFRSDFDLRAEVARIRVPVLILQGRDDPYGTEAHALLAERLLPGLVRTVLLSARHAPHVETAEESITAIAGFVAPLLISTGQCYGALQPLPPPPPARGGEKMSRSERLPSPCGRGRGRGSNHRVDEVAIGLTGEDPIASA